MLRKIIDETSKFFVRHTGKIAEQKMGEKMGNFSAAAANSTWGFLNTSLGSSIAGAVVTGVVTYKVTKSYRNEQVANLMAHTEKLETDLGKSSDTISELRDTQGKLITSLLELSEKNNTLRDEHAKQMHDAQNKTDELRNILITNNMAVNNVYNNSLYHCEKRLPLAIQQAEDYKEAYKKSYCFWRVPVKERFAHLEELNQDTSQDCRQEVSC